MGLYVLAAGAVLLFVFRVLPDILRADTWKARFAYLGMWAVAVLAANGLLSFLV